MKFNGEVWMTIPVVNKQKDEPDEFVIVKNKKSKGGIIPYARFGKDWTTTVPARILIRELALALHEERKGMFDEE